MCRFWHTTVVSNGNNVSVWRRLNRAEGIGEQREKVCCGQRVEWEGLINRMRSEKRPDGGKEGEGGSGRRCGDGVGQIAGDFNNVGSSE